MSTPTDAEIAAIDRAISFLEYTEELALEPQLHEPEIAALRSARDRLEGLAALGEPAIRIIEHFRLAEANGPVRTMLGEIQDRIRDAYRPKPPVRR